MNISTKINTYFQRLKVDGGGQREKITTLPNTNRSISHAGNIRVPSWEIVMNTKQWNEKEVNGV
jgi:hypothetical protein